MALHRPAILILRPRQVMPPLTKAGTVKPMKSCLKGGSLAREREPAAMLIQTGEHKGRGRSVSFASDQERDFDMTVNNLFSDDDDAAFNERTMQPMRKN